MDPQLFEVITSIATEIAKKAVFDARVILTPDPIPQDGDESGEAPTATSCWNDVFQPRAEEATTTHGKELVARCACAPDRDLLDAAADKTKVYCGLPQTPPARGSDGQDKFLAGLQRKLGTAMAALVESAELKEGPTGRAHMAALGFLRSAFEDVHQERRARAAGYQRAVLEPRPDQVQASLFSAEEQAKLRSAGKQGSNKGNRRSRGRGGQRSFRAPGRSRSPSPAFRSRSRSRSGGSSSGKGKGKRPSQK